VVTHVELPFCDGREKAEKAVIRIAVATAVRSSRRHVAQRQVVGA